MLNRVAKRILCLQLGIAATAAIIWGLTTGLRAASGAAVGGGISAVLTFYVAVRVFARPAGDSPEQAFSALVRAEIMKLLLAVVLISIAIIAFADQVIAVVTTLAVTLSAYWFALLRADD